MMKNSLRISIVVSMLFSAFLFVPSAFAATFVVTKTADTADGTCDVDCSLREAVIAANTAGGTNIITLPSGTYTLTRTDVADNNSSNGDLDVIAGSSITINGVRSSDTIIDGNGGVTSERVIHLVSTSSSLTLNNLEVTGGTQDDGAGIYNGGGTLTISGVVVTANTGTNNGGGVYSQGAAATFTATDSTISDNISNSAAGIYNSTGTTTLTRVLVDGNAASSSAGGVSNSAGTLIIDASTISNNTALTVSANAKGGGVDSRNSSTFTITNSLITGNSAYQNGAGVFSFCNNGVSTITNSTITANTSTNGQGGGVQSQCSSGAPTQTDEIDISHSTIASNTASSGGGIGLDSDGDDVSTVVVRNSIVANNTATTGSQCKIATGTGVITSNGYNIESANTCGFAGTGDLVSTDPLLDTGGLADHGGDTEVIALQAGSPALDVGICTDISLATVTTDQRGYTRPENVSCDIGAYEKDQTDPVITVTGGTPVSLECHATYSDLGATANDNWDGTVAATGDDSAVDANTVGSYDVGYSAVDADENTGVATRTVTVGDHTIPTITVVGSTEVTQEAGDTYTDAGATASDVCDSSVSVATSSPVDTAFLGDYTVTYTATDDSTNAATEKTRLVHVTDTTVPVITLIGESDVSIDQGLTYSDLSATAADSFEGDITESLLIDNPVDTSVPGVYTITYNVTDSSHNAATEVTRTVTVVADTTDPVITVVGDDPYTVLQGGDFTDSGATATDNVAGDVTTDVIVTGSVDTDVVGEYTLTYTVSDLSGNTAVATRTVDVVSRGDVVSVVSNGDGTVTVTYTDESTQTFTPFSGSTTTVRVALSTDSARIVVLKHNGRQLVVLDAILGTQLDSIALAKHKQKFGRVKVFNYYNDAKDEVIVVVKKKHVARVYGISLSGGSVLSHKNVHKITNVHAKKLKIARKHKRVLIKTKSGTLLARYRVSKKAKLTLVP